MKDDVYVSSSSPGSDTEGEEHRLRLHLVGVVGELIAA